MKELKIKSNAPASVARIWQDDFNRTVFIRANDGDLVAIGKQWLPRIAKFVQQAAKNIK